MSSLSESQLRYYREAVACNEYSSEFDKKSKYNREARKLKNGRRQKKIKRKKRKLPNQFIRQQMMEHPLIAIITEQNGDEINCKCTVCGVTMSMMSMNQHLSGKKHLKKTKIETNRDKHKNENKNIHNTKKHAMQPISNSHYNNVNASFDQYQQYSLQTNKTNDIDIINIKRENVNNKRSFNELMDGSIEIKNRKKRKLNNSNHIKYEVKNENDLNKNSNINGNQDMVIVTDEIIIKKEIKPESIDDLPILESVNEDISDNDNNDDNDVLLVSMETVSHHHDNSNRIDLVSADNMKVFVKFCPNCRTQVNRTQQDINNTCSIMTCRECCEWTYWCWDCNKEIDMKRKDMRCLNCRKRSRKIRNCKQK